MAVLAFHDWLARAKRNQRNPEDVKIRARHARLEHGILTAARTLLHAAAWSVIVANDLSGAEK
ncbi:MAG TPA: hypothetical protein VFT66_01520 [Roseiflexaceae bacterium]|nr:hypothetical protein [Roseiflexaceae bacterium]